MYLESGIINEVRQKDKYYMFNLNVEFKKLNKYNKMKTDIDIVDKLLV